MIYFTSTIYNLLSVCLQIEERINIDTLEALKRTFQDADTNKSGQLELNEFKQLLKSKLSVAGNRVSTCLVFLWSKCFCCFANGFY